MGMEIDIVVFDKKKVPESLIAVTTASDGKVQRVIDYHDGVKLFEDEVASHRRNYELRDALNAGTGVRAPSDYTLVDKPGLLAARAVLYERAGAVLASQVKETNINITHTTIAIDIWQGIASIEKVLREVDLEDMYIGYLWG